MQARSTPSGSARPRPPRIAFAIVALAVALLAAGCGAVTHMTADEGNPEAGRVLFKKPTLAGGQPGCGTCHVMEDAGTTGIVGPNLDTTFGIVREQGFDESTIRDVVRGQIAYPETETAEGGPGSGMPANLVEGQDADDVADYVARCAGVPNCLDD